LEILSGQLPSGRLSLTDSDPLITLLQEEMSLPLDTPPGVADILGYLQHYFQELTERQNVLEHTINTTLTGLMVQLQQLTQLMTSPAPAPSIYT